MLYFSSEVKMEGPKKSVAKRKKKIFFWGGAKFFFRRKGLLIADSLEA